ncbi:DUF362 domain-containing protein [candidate division KSB1 bacterium]
MRGDIRRRDFLAGISAGLVGLGLGSCGSSGDKAGGQSAGSSCLMPASPRVGLVKGGDRKTIVYDALKLIEDDVSGAIRNKKVVIKPNLTRVSKKDWLASSHVDGVRAILEFLKPIYNKKVIIAEGTGLRRPIGEALESYDYYPLADEYDVEFYDLLEDDYTTLYVLDKDLKPMPILTSKLMLDPDVYLISASVMKTHSLALVTLGLKNVVLAAPMNLKEHNYRGDLHQDPVRDDPRYLNYNMFMMARHVTPDLSVVDGFVGMEGEGPLFGDPVEAGVALAGTDFLAVERVGVELMGFDFQQIGHLVYCADAGMGEADLTKIDLLGDTISGCKKKFKPSEGWEKVIVKA